MNNNLTIFNYEANEVRTIEKDGQPYFVLADVCKALGLANPTMVAKKLDNDERAKSDLGLKEKNVTIVNESGLYAVILRSDKPQAKAFRKWITSDVLPTLRKTGSYITQPNIDTAPKKPTNSEEIIKIRKANLLYKLLKDSSPSVKPLIQSQIVEMLTGKQLTVAKYTRQEIQHYGDMMARGYGDAIINDVIKIAKREGMDMSRGAAVEIIKHSVGKIMQLIHINKNVEIRY